MWILQFLLCPRAEPEICLCKHIFVEAHPVWRWTEGEKLQFHPSIWMKWGNQTEQQEFSGLQLTHSCSANTCNSHSGSPICSSNKLGRYKGWEAEAERGELPPSTAVLPVSSWNWWNSVNNHPVGFATFTKYKKYTHKLSRGDVALWKWVYFNWNALSHPGKR